MRPTTLIAPLFLAGCLAVVSAQEVPAPPPADPNSETLTIEAAEAGLETIESGDSDELTRKALGDRYREAVESLKQAAQFRALEQDYRQALETGPDETVKLRAELDGMDGDEVSALPGSLNPQSSNEELEDALSRETGELSLLKTELKDLEDALLTIRNRPIEMRERLIAAQAELKTTTGSQETIRAGISGDANPSQKADQARLQARQQKLEAEISMIEQEDASDEIRIALAEVSRDLNAARIEAGEARVAAIRALASTRLNQQARQAEALVERIQRDVPNAPEFLETLQFGWIAAALGVGIGFGLQEVVANFICGIILLFERPIRVGDVVTVDGVDGVVSRIQIRATTITNWDRKELIIPNKNFITGTVLNWTLSNALNRIVIVVGAAYGSDTERARQILIDVAKDHPRILEDPLPLATFEAFDDSSLRLLLRCYVPDMDGRIVTITELHTEIDKRFREAGVEVAFPQRDLHLRSADAGGSLGGPASES